MGMHNKMWSLEQALERKFEEVSGLRAQLAELERQLAEANAKLEAEEKKYGACMDALEKTADIGLRMQDKLEAERKKLKQTDKDFHEMRTTLERKLTAAQEQNRRLVEAFGLSNTWPLVDVLSALIKATGHLLHDHNCDHHGYEKWDIARDEAKRYVYAINDALAACKKEGE